MSARPISIQNTRRYRLASRDGLWLHFSCTKLVASKHYSWVGSAAQLAVTRQRFPLASDLVAVREVAVHGYQ